MSGGEAAAGVPRTLDATDFKAIYDGLVANVEKVVRGKTDVVRLALVAVCAEGHVVFEDVPGTGKSVLARALTQSTRARDSRIQCTPDMLPGDITGSSIFDPRSQEFSFRPGPIFCNVLLADEVNRATPKTQSALLEAMAERKVSIDGTTYPLPRPFIVLATQNPVEQAGTFPLPEAQLDRFLFKLAMGYPDARAEKEVIFANDVQLSVESLGAVIDTEVVNAMIQYAPSVQVSDPVADYIIGLTQATRNDPTIQLGASPRASIALLRASRVLAASDGRTHVYPDDVRHVLKPVMGHRVILSPEAVLRGETVEGLLDRLVAKVKAPLVSATTTSGPGVVSPAGQAAPAASAMPPAPSAVAPAAGAAAQATAPTTTPPPPAQAVATEPAASR